MALQFRTPDDAELLEFFGAEPVARVVEDGYWCYQISDARGAELRFSFNLYEASVQTVVSLGNLQIATVSHEGADRMVLRDRKLRCEFSSSGMKTTLTVEIGPKLSVVWSSLRTE
jgi:hypothetical protein